MSWLIMTSMLVTTLSLLLRHEVCGLISSLADGQVGAGKDRGEAAEWPVRGFLLGYRNTRLTEWRSHELPMPCPS